MTNDIRQNDNIEVEEVIELAQEIAMEAIEMHWLEMGVQEPMIAECGGFTDLAQDKYEAFYHQAEADIIKAMKANPSMDIRQIDDLVSKQRGA